MPPKNKKEVKKHQKSLEERKVEALESIAASQKKQTELAALMVGNRA